MKKTHSTARRLNRWKQSALFSLFQLLELILLLQRLCKHNRTTPGAIFDSVIVSLKSMANTATASSWSITAVCTIPSPCHRLAGIATTEFQRGFYSGQENHPRKLEYPGENLNDNATE